MDNLTRFDRNRARAPFRAPRHLFEPSRSRCQPQHPVVPSFHASLNAGTTSSQLAPEVDAFLDDFDKNLLEEYSQGSDLLPPNASVTVRRTQTEKPITSLFVTPLTQHIGDNSQPFLQMPPSSSSPTKPFSSPTTAILQNRKQEKTLLPSVETSISRASTFRRKQDSSPNGRQASSLKLKDRVSLGPAPPMVQGIQLVPTTALPDQLRTLFGFEIFNAVQSKCFPAAFKTDDNVVISAPTGSGKTVVMELAICRLLVESKTSDFKVVYQAPTKSLCAERQRDWQSKFGSFGLRSAELTGDTDYAHLRNVQSANIIITTPEKWDSITRKWKDHTKLMQLVKLFLVDEVHILKESRGATLEAVISRMKSVSSNIRFVALSATVPNSEDIATWLGKNPDQQHLPAFREVFGESFRPVELRKHVYGFEAKGNDFAFESMLTKQLPDIISRFGRAKPIMIFCSTRRASTTTAKMLADMWTASAPSQRLWKGPERSLSIQGSELKVTATAGVAFHHGGVSPADRRTIEDAFLHGQINIICSTSTLAVGVNLPCYLVILKGTTCWTENGLQEYSDLEVMQMLGRAGRPQFETSACAVILTRTEKVARYEKMVSGHELLESCLHQNLIEHLNAEVGLGTVCDLKTAKQWLASSFLYVRLKRNPSHYQFREGCHHSSEDELLEQLCEKDIGLLQDANLITKSTHLKSTKFGDIMTRYYISFDTMKSFMSLPPKAKTSEILFALTQAREFKEIRMLASERSFYREINKAPEIKFPIKVDIALQAHKISLIVQAELGNVTLPDGDQYKKHLQQHRIDKLTVFIQSNRLIRCIIDCQIHMTDSVSARHALELGRSLAAHVWDNTASQLRQVEGLGEVAVRKLASASISSIDTLINTEPSRIEHVLGKNPPFGLGLLKKLESFPNLRVSIKEKSRKLKSGKGTTIRFKVEIGFLNDRVPHFFNKKSIYVCFLAETSDGRLIDFRRFSAKQLQHGEEVFLSVELTKPTHHLNCFVMCDEVAGTSKYAELVLTGIPDSTYPHQHWEGGLKDISNPPHDSHPKVKWVDEFDDGGIEDTDLLSLETKGEKIEVVEDIDELLDRDSKKVGYHQSSKRSIDRPHDSENEEDAEVTAYREPVQLRNGRWTCQHDCNERKKNCKHKCCREGVAKPKRRSKLEVKAKEENKSQRKLTDLSGMRTKGKPGAEELRSLNQLHSSILSKEISELTAQRKKVSDEPISKRPRLSDGKDQNKSNAAHDEIPPRRKVMTEIRNVPQKDVTILDGKTRHAPENHILQAECSFLADDMMALDCD